MADKNNKDLVKNSLLKSIGNLKKIAEEDKVEQNQVEEIKNEPIIQESNNKIEIIEDVESLDKNINENTPSQKTQADLKKQENQPEQTPSSLNEIVVTYNNPMKNLLEEYNAIVERIQQEQKELLSNFKKSKPQSEIYANPTIQVRRDIYTALNNYILDMRLGKTKVLNEIFMLGIDSFIKKYSENKQ